MINCKMSGADNGSESGESSADWHDQRGLLEQGSGEGWVGCREAQREHIMLRTLIKVFYADIC